MIEDGFYWIKIEEAEHWRIGELENGVWWIIGSGDKWTPDQIHEVGPQINQPE